MENLKDELISPTVVGRVNAALLAQSMEADDRTTEQRIVMTPASAELRTQKNSERSIVLKGDKTMSNDEHRRNSSKKLRSM